MKLPDLRKALKNATVDKVVEVAAEIYKKVPAGKKDDLDTAIWSILGVSDPPAAEPKAPAEKKVKVNMDTLADAVDKFVENATDGNYYYANRSVSKARRSKWRFEVIDFVKKLDSIEESDPRYPKAVELYSSLYKVLSRGNIEHLFHGDNPFHSIMIDQDDFLDRVAAGMLTVHQDDEDQTQMMTDLITLICRGDSGPDMYHRTLLLALADHFDTEDLKELALDVAKELSDNQIKRHGATRTWTFIISPDSIEEDHFTEFLSELAMIVALSISAETFLDNMTFYYRNSFQSDTEIALYVALDIVNDEKSRHPDRAEELDKLWISVYEDALNRKIKPRKNLQDQYAKRTNPQS